MTQTDSYSFKAEVQQLLHILAHSLYKDQDIFLRELISNASDAMTRMHFETLTNRDILDPDAELAIRIETPETEEENAPKQIIIKDSGIGMTQEELIQNLGTIAQSGAREFLKKLENGSEIDPSDVIGQFGVGFYSVFMVASEVKVVSRSYKKDAEAAAWISDGGDTFRLEVADKSERGTEIYITLKQDAHEFASSWKLRQIVKKHSDFVRYPIYIGDEVANQQESLWRKNTSQVDDEAYKKFYQQMTMDFEEPLKTIHFSSDAPVNLRALLFIPNKREPGILASRKDPGVMLYSHNVLIQEYCTDLLPTWLSFIDGVVDSEDISLNVSRETVQSNRIMRQLAKTVKGRVMRELKKMADKDKEKYAQFWEQFSRTFKEAIATDPSVKEEILPYFRYPSSKSGDDMTSLDDYLERMPDSQEEIYYVLGDSVTSVANSPHLDPFKAHDVEVLYWVDPMDSFLTSTMIEYKDKKFRNIDEAELELPEVEDDEHEETAVSSLGQADFNRFIGRCVTTLGERVKEVRASKVLKDSPIRLVAPEGATNRGMDRISRMIGQDYEVPQRILEVNRNHPLISHLARLVTHRPQAEIINLSIEQLYASALVQEGLHPNPTDMLPRIQNLIELATAGEAIDLPAEEE